MNVQSRYPGFDVMEQAPEWDDHTREIVKKRLEPVTSFQYLTPDEARLLAAIGAALIDDGRAEIGAFIAKHFDSRLQSAVGEDQRKADAPPEADLIRQGLAAIEAASRNNFKESFAGLPLAERRTLLDQVERGELPGTGPWAGLPQPQLFQKLLDLTVGAYYSHPAVWSEIGYAGPAYPRGYVRVELDLVDPWEPRRPSGAARQKE